MLKCVAVITGLLLGWFGVMATLMLTAEIVPNALVLGPADRVLRNVRDDIQFVRLRPGTMVVTSTEPGYVRSLYDAGAWLVLPSLAAGCLDLRSTSWASVESSS